MEQLFINQIPTKFKNWKLALVVLLTPNQQKPNLKGFLNIDAYNLKNVFVLKYGNEKEITLK